MARIDSNTLTKQIAEFICELRIENSFTTDMAKKMEMNSDYDYDSLVATANFKAAQYKKVKNQPMTCATCR